MNRLKEILDIQAVSSREEKVRSYLEKNIKSDETYYDNLGGVAFEFQGNTSGNNIIIVAHMDEVGYIVKSISENGIIKVINIGGIMCETAVSQRVVLHSDTQEFEGVILNQSPHGNSSEKLEVSDLNVDFGFENKSDALNKGVKIGDMIAFKNDFQILQNNRIATKAADNRLGCLALIEIADLIGSNRDFAGNIILAASTQEEAGLRGAEAVVRAAGKNIDNALIIDVSPVEDLKTEDNGVVGNGTLVRIKDPSCILDYNEVNILRELAQTNDIKYQEFFSKGGTDATRVQTIDTGIKTAALCVPARNLHSNNTVFCLDDYNETVKLAYQYIMRKVN